MSEKRTAEKQFRDAKKWYDDIEQKRKRKKHWTEILGNAIERDPGIMLQHGRTSGRPKKARKLRHGKTRK